jgi:hypothetical protein
MTFAGALRSAALAGAVVFAAHPARADGIPDAYAPLRVPAAGTPPSIEFDLTPALERARREGRWIYLYLGARDCPFCRRYEAFLARHADELVPHFRARYLVVELRSMLSVTAAELRFRVGSRGYGYAEWMEALGDERARRLVYPSVWLLDGVPPRPLMQMPGGTGTFETVAEQLEILRLEN